MKRVTSKDGDSREDRRAWRDAIKARYPRKKVQWEAMKRCLNKKGKIAGRNNGSGGGRSMPVATP